MRVLGVIGRDLFTGVPIAEKIIRALAVYFGLVALLRVGGRRDLAELNSFDLVVLLLLSNTVQNAIIGNETTLTEGLLGAAVLVAVNGIVARVVVRNARARRLLEGSSEVLIRDGVLDERNLRRLALRRSDVELAVRRQGANGIDEVETATLEPGGAVVVNLRPADENAKMKDIRRLEDKVDAILAALGPQKGAPQKGAT